MQMLNLDPEQLAKEKGYTLDYLTCGSPIFQVKNFYTFTSDSIRLAHAVDKSEIDTLIDLCSGSGVVGLEVAGKVKVHNLYLVELQRELAEASRDSSRYNKSNSNIQVLNTDVKNLKNLLNQGMADVITCNPPYFKVGSGDVPSSPSRAMARHEITLNIKDIIQTSNYLLKENGRMYLIHVKSRLNEIERVLKENGFIIEDTEYISGKLERVIIRARKI